MSSVQQVPLKISLVRCGEVVEVRRKQLVNPSYEAVAKAAAEIARGRYRLQYVDTDSDHVTMSSQEEWEECLSSWDTARPLMLRVELRGGMRLPSRSSSSSSKSRSRSVGSARRHCHSSKHRSRSPIHCKGPLGMAAHGHPHTDFPPLRYHAWLAKRAAAQNTAQPVAKCTNCDNEAIGFAGFCCRRCAHGSQTHSRHCTQKPFTAPAEGSAQPSVEAPLQQAVPSIHPFLLFRGCPMGAIGGTDGKRVHRPGCKGLLFMRRGKGCKAMHGHGGKGCKGRPEDAERRCHRGMKEANPELIGQKCNNCAYQTTGIVDAYCCFACMHGKGHGRRCKQMQFDSAEPVQGVQPEVAASEDETKHHGKGWKGMRSHSWRRVMKEEVKPELIGQKCTNCTCQTTGLVDSFCCRRCMHGKGHGRRCQQLQFDSAEQARESEPVAEVQQKPEESQPHQESAAPEDITRRHGKGFKGMHGHFWRRGMKEANPELIGQKCSNCSCQTTGILDAYCCFACKHGKGHGGRCKQLQFESAEPVREETSKVEEAESQPEAVCFGAPKEEDDDAKADTKTDVAQPLGSKCQGCAFQTTGVVESYCCWACKHGRGHGKRCKQLPLEDDDEDSFEIVRD